ncbi:response regulator transcription factor [Streptomyces olivaceus]|nr:response regulator transcription factor [Streptomyces olivaceus]MBZ6226348.1 response regulator transcription factor [Streptomyces olivaceus]
MASDPGERLHLVLVDDEELVRVALRVILQREEDMTVVTEAHDAVSALVAVDRHRPDVVLLDVRMPGRDGLDVARDLTARARPPRVLMLSTFDSGDLMLGSLQAGAHGYVLQDTPPARIAEAVRVAAEGGPVLSPGGAAAQVISAATAPSSGHNRHAARLSARRRLSTLSVREGEAARGVAEGLDNAEIAARMGVGVATVKAYVGSVFGKLGLRNRVRLALVVRDAEE